jgi:uncharacterized repeat protein (TIGR03803 family)
MKVVAWWIFALAVAGVAHADTRFTVIANFDATGNTPAAALTRTTDGHFAGTTTQGGPANAGTVFTMTASGDVTILHAFTGGADGADPYGALVQDADGSLVGTTSSGGAANAGTVFRISSTGNFTLIYTFGAGTDGAYPYAGLLRATDGNLYGTTSGAGGYGAGTVFKLAADGTFSVVYTFTGGADGGYPYSSLVQGADGRFCGTTSAGGATGYGTVFCLGGDGTLATLYAFTGGSDGAYPYGGVAVATDASLYGTAAEGGDYGQGTVFKLAPDGTFTVVHEFVGDASDGGYPVAGLAQAADGSYYGTTYVGGPQNAGSVFHLTLDGGYAIVYAFAAAEDGGYPYAGLTQGAAGTLYGTASYGGAQGVGTAFQLSTVASLVTWNTPAAIVYGTRLGSGQLDATASVPGTFVYSPATGTRLHAGSHALTVVFTPTDPALPVTTASVTVTVLPLIPLVTWTPPPAIAYGTPLGSAQLNARATVDGTFVYEPGPGSIIPLGVQTLSATFYPASSDYTMTGASVSIVVNPGVPVITWTPVAMVSGTALGPWQLNAVANTPGTFVYTPAAGTVLAAGVQTLTATFTPVDSVDYQSTTASATVNVSVPSVSGGGNEYALQYAPGAGAKGLTIGGYALAADPVYGTVAIGTCSYYTQTSGSGRGGGYKTITTYYNHTCTWDAYGRLLGMVNGAPAAPAPIGTTGTQTIYASDPASGIYTGVDSALPTRGFVFTPGSHYTWLTPSPYAVIAQAVTTMTLTVKSDGNMPLSVVSAQATAAAGVASVTGTTCFGTVPVGSTCTVTVRYDPTTLRSPTGLAYDTVTVHLGTDAGLAVEWAQRYTIQLTPANTTDGGGGNWGNETAGVLRASGDARRAGAGRSGPGGTLI